jgi:hypothetical protein
MSKEIILDNEFTFIWYYPESRIIHNQLKKYVPTPNLKELLLKVLETVETRGATKWLSDSSNSGPIPDEMDNWVTTNWRPRLKKAGCKFIAMIIPAKVIGNMSYKRVTHDEQNSSIVLQMFPDPAGAMKWLESCN